MDTYLDAMGSSTKLHRPLQVPLGVPREFVLHGQSQRRIETHSVRYLGEASALGPREALAGLLKGRSPYHATSSSVVPVEISKVALTENAHEGACLEQLLPLHDRHFLDGNLKDMLRPQSHVYAISEAMGVCMSYMDERLKRSSGLYAQFIKSA